MSGSRYTANPSGGVSPGRRPMQPALGLDLMRRVLASDNVRAAWKQVRANQGAAGVDGITIAEFPNIARALWLDMRGALEDGTYRPSPVRRKAIPKPSGGQRLLGIPTVMDRVIQQAISQVLTPLFDPHFSESSFGFRPGRSAHGAIKQIQRYYRAGFHVAVDLDLAKFFDRVNHDILMSAVAKRVTDKALLRLIGLYLRAGVVVDGERRPTREGVPQGGPLSPLLSNIMLDMLDRELEHRGHRFARYADDVLIVVGSERAGERVMSSVTRWLERRLRLEVNVDKSQVSSFRKVTFLGFRLRGRRGTINWSAASLRRFKAEVRRLTNRSWGVSMAYRLHKLATYIRGWMGYFGLADRYRPLPGLDSWLRRRIRMCHWNQWRRIRTRIRKLLELGVPRRWAVRTGMSSKGPWHMSRNHSINKALSDAYLANQGLVSIKDLWFKFAHLR
jgi:RNA-directed DNA polymerase